MQIHLVPTDPPLSNSNTAFLFCSFDSQTIPRIFEKECLYLKGYRLA